MSSKLKYKKIYRKIGLTSAIFMTFILAAGVTIVFVLFTIVTVATILNVNLTLDQYLSFFFGQAAITGALVYSFYSLYLGIKYVGDKDE